VGIQEEQLLLRQARQPPIEGGAVGDDLAGAFLERDKNAGRALPACGVNQALQGEDGFARARAADEQARAVARQPAAAQLIESLDAGRQLGQSLSGFAFRRDLGSPLKALAADMLPPVGTVSQGSRFVCPPTDRNLNARRLACLHAA